MWAIHEPYETIKFPGNNLFSNNNTNLHMQRYPTSGLVYVEMFNSSSHHVIQQTQRERESKAVYIWRSMLSLDCGYFL